VNTVNLIGQLTADPKLRRLPNKGQSVCEMRIAVSNGNGREDTNTLFIDVATYGPQAEACAKYLSKGRKVAVEGRLVYREWETDGQRRSKHSVTGRVEFLGGQRKDTANANGGDPEAVPAGVGAPDDEF
jgi:single-strand DNA-binding protein